MRLPSLNPLLLISTLATAVLPARAEHVLRSSSLAACQENSGFTASLFDVVFTPDNATAAINMIATSSIEGHVLFDIVVLAYGLQIIRTTVDPCKIGLGGMCPMTSGKMNNPFIIGGGQIPQSAISQIPGIAYTFPDLDATARIYINMTSGDLAGTTIACLEAEISNGKTVDLVGVKWATAAVIALAIFSSALVHGLGFVNAASHIAANSLALFSYFQAQAMLGLCSVPLPPVAMAWTQDFQWTMGIIRIGFMQTALTWYQRATGGTASIIFDTLHTVSVQIQKRSLPLLEPAAEVVRRSVGEVAEHASNIAKRSYIMTSYGSYVVYGIQRVGFRARIETTNLFLTSLTFFYFLALFTTLGVILFKLGCELAIKTNLVKGETFSEFRNGWLTSLKGILFRLTLICFPQLAVFCLWEFTPIARDSPAAVTLAVFFFFGALATLSFAAYKVIRIARRSVALHRNPAYILFSDPRALNKWGFLYVQYRASAYYFIVPTIVYILVKGMFVALAQESGTVQAVALIIIEAAALITVSVLRPFMDKSTNSFNIAICAINFVNAIFLFVFTDVFGLPGLVIGVVGVVLWIANAAFALILLLMLIITTGILLFHNNPDTRYQFMNDDRTSFIKSSTHVATVSELDALAATARGPGKGLDIEDDESARSSPANMGHNGLPRPGTAGSNASPNRYSLKSVRDSARNSVRMDPYLTEKSSGHHLRNQHSGSIRAPSPLTASGSEGSLSVPVPPPQTNFSKPQGSSPWQRGAGYD